MRYIDLEHQFFGRQDIVKLLKKRISDLKEGFRQNVAILGNPFIGKTAFLKNFVFNIDDDSVTPIYLELDRDKDKS
ncbi:MAG TPA: hypothetical protein PKH98_05995, partial [Candidatus Omnitrophota bacterium]|nr:hypothetical protein [Candidatus Omnitrophota bacterium]